MSFATPDEAHEGNGGNGATAAETSRDSTLLTLVVQNLPDMVFVKDADTLQFISMNRAGQKLLGYEEEEFAGKTDYDFFPKGEADFFTARDRDVLATGKLLEIAAEPIHTRDQGLRILHTKKIPIVDQTGRPRYLLGISEDITERQRAAEELRKKTALVKLLQRIATAANEASSVSAVMRDAIDNICSYTGWPVGHVYFPAGDASGSLIPSTIWHKDMADGFEVFRRVTERTRLAPGTGLPGRVFSAGKPAWIMDVLEDDNFPRARVMESIGVKAGFAFPVLVGTEVVAVLEFFAPTAEPPNEPLLEVMMGIGAQLGRVVERERAMQLQHQLVGVVGHDLRNPLAAIITTAEHFLSAPDFPAKHAKSAARIKVVGNRMSRIIRDLLDYSRARVGESFHLVSTAVDFDRLCRDLLGEFESSHPKQTIVYEPGEAAIVYCDSDRITQVLQNLLTNALKYTAQALPVHLAWESNAEDVVITVRNQGPAIPPDLLPFIFEPFRSGSQLQLKKHSIGLGLFIVQELVRAHGGRASVQSSSEGTTFTVVLPKRTPDALAWAAAQS